MNPFGLPEQDPAVIRIREAAARDTLSHALLFTGGEPMPAARFAAAALECEGEGTRPCGQCPACRKVLADIHPDVITVQDEQHKNIAVDVVRAVRSDAHIRPNEGRWKVYLFPDCGVLTEQDQNVLLKVVEEGPPYAAFLFCAQSAAQMLPTLRSRCVELKLRPVQQAAPSAQAREDAQALCRAVASRRRGAVTAVAVGLERRRLTREDLAALLEECREAFAAALLEMAGAADPASQTAAAAAKNLTKTQIMRTIELLERYRKECSYNVGAGHVLGALAAELEGIL